MKKVLFTLLAATCFSHVAFAAITAHPVGHSRISTIADALNQAKAAKIKNDIGTMIVVIDYDTTNNITARYSLNSTCDTITYPTFFGPGQSAIIKIDNYDAPNHICLNEADSSGNPGSFIWEGDVSNAAVVSVYVSNGQYVVYNTPVA